MTSTQVFPVSPVTSEWVQAQTLRAGDVLLYQDTEVTLLTDPADATDIFGRRMVKWTATRADTHAVGAMMFGPEGLARRLSRTR